MLDVCSVLSSVGLLKGKEKKNQNQSNSSYVFTDDPSPKYVLFSSIQKE